jgi:hypothetical protein
MAGYKIAGEYEMKMKNAAAVTFFGDPASARLRSDSKREPYREHRTPILFAPDSDCSPMHLHELLRDGETESAPHTVAP